MAHSRDDLKSVMVKRILRKNLTVVSKVKVEPVSIYATLGKYNKSYLFTDQLQKRQTAFQDDDPVNFFTISNPYRSTDASKIYFTLFFIG